MTSNTGATSVGRLADHAQHLADRGLVFERLAQFRRALLDRVQRLLRLVEQPRVLQRHAHRRGHRAEQADGGVVEGVLALQADEADRALAPGRRPSPARTRSSGWAPCPARCGCRGLRSRRGCAAPAAGRCQGLARTCCGGRARTTGWRCAARARRRTACAPGRWRQSIQLMLTGRCCEQRAQPVADHVDDGLEVQLRRPCPAGCR